MFLLVQKPQTNVRTLIMEQLMNMEGVATIMALMLPNVDGMTMMILPQGLCVALANDGKFYVPSKLVLMF